MQDFLSNLWHLIVVLCVGLITIVVFGILKVLHYFDFVSAETADPMFALAVSGIIFGVVVAGAVVGGLLWLIWRVRKYILKAAIVGLALFFFLTLITLVIV